MPQLGSGPTTETSGSGYFTTKDYVSILNKGAQLGIRIVPEIVAPGHNAAAIQSMEHRFRSTNDSTYRLMDSKQEHSVGCSVFLTKISIFDKIVTVPTTRSLQTRSLRFAIF